MPPGMFNSLEDNRHADWGNMLEARREFEAGETPSGGAGQTALVCGAAIFALIIIAMALFAS